MFRAPKEYMISHPYLGMGEGNNGYFAFEREGIKFRVVSSDGAGWEHVSVSIANKKRCPTWEEMCMIKNLFWSEEDCVIQYHPPKSQYVNNVGNCLHLWKPTNSNIPIPDSWLVGIK